MSADLIGFSMAGICRRFLVTPPSMIWPENLVAAAIINTLHPKETTGSQDHGGMSRKRFFTYVFIVSIFYCQLLRNLLYTVLTCHYCSVHSLLFLHYSLEFLVGLLDCAQECQD
jgi:hypothetical protein